MLFGYVIRVYPTDIIKTAPCVLHERGLSMQEVLTPIVVVKKYPRDDSYFLISTRLASNDGIETVAPSTVVYVSMPVEHA